MTVTMLKEVFDPQTCKQRFPIEGNPWIYRYRHPSEPWILSIATYGQPQSNSLSLGGFRIAPATRTDRPHYDNDKEALDLARGMEGKVYWSRLLGVGGPLGLKQVHRIVGGKCVLLPTPEARIGQPRDFELLDFATQCLADFENATGVHLTTGQDLGHGLMSDGKTQSLDYLHSKFEGSVRANTAGPTGEGNFQLLKGMLAGLGIPLSQARIGLIGCGNVGGHVLRRLHGEGAEVFAIEAYEPKRQELSQQLNIEMWAPEAKAKFLELPMDALVVNASGGSLDTPTIDILLNQDRLAIVCGCENLSMPDPNDADRLSAAGKLFAPTQLGGMFGYLTAVEEYLCTKEGQAFDDAPLIRSASVMADIGSRAAAYVRSQPAPASFRQALVDLYGS